MHSSPSPYLKHLYVCVNRRADGRACCAEREGEQIRERIKAYVQEHGLKGKVRVSGSGCMDLCARGANVMVYPGQRWYSQVTLETIGGLIEEELDPLIPLPDADKDRRPAPEADGSIRAFLFDLGNVLVRFDHWAAARKIADGSGTTAERVFQLFFESPLVAAHDEGRISTREFYEGVKREIGWDRPYTRFLEAWNGIFSEDGETMWLLRRLLLDFPCFLISNTNRPHFEFLRVKYPILHDMQGWILSYEVGHLKPHPLIYQRALELAQRPAPEIFYVDDRPDLIEAGKGLGFQTHRFAGAQPLIEELRLKGVLV